MIYGLGEGKYSKSVELARPSEGLTATAFGDFNNDSFIDVATGEFNINQFYYYATAGFEQCIVKESSSLELIATFKQVDSISSGNEEKSAGGLLWLLYLLFPLVVVRCLVRSEHSQVG